MRTKSAIHHNLFERFCSLDANCFGQWLGCAKSTRKSALQANSDVSISPTPKPFLVAGPLKVLWTSSVWAKSRRSAVAPVKPGKASTPQPLGLTIVADEPCKLLPGIAHHLSQVVPVQTLLRLAKLAIAELPQRSVPRWIRSKTQRSRCPLKTPRPAKPSRVSVVHGGLHPRIMKSPPYFRLI